MFFGKLLTWIPAKCMRKVRRNRRGHDGANIGLLGISQRLCTEAVQLSPNDNRVGSDLLRNSSVPVEYNCWKRMGIAVACMLLYCTALNWIKRCGGMRKEVLRTMCICAVKRTEAVRIGPVEQISIENAGVGLWRKHPFSRNTAQKATIRCFWSAIAHTAQREKASICLLVTATQTLAFSFMSY